MLSHWSRDQLVPQLYLLSIIGPQKWLKPILSPTQVGQDPLCWVQDTDTNTLRVLIWMFLKGCLAQVSDTHPRRVRKGLHASGQPILCPTTSTTSSATAISLMTTEELQSRLWLIQLYYSAVGTNGVFYAHMGQHLLIFWMYVKWGNKRQWRHNLNIFQYYESLTKIMYSVKCSGSGSQRLCVNETIQTPGLRNMAITILSPLRQLVIPC